MEVMREPQVRDFRKLAVYQKGMLWISEIREILKVWKWEDRQVIGNQLLRSSTSVMANLVEGNSNLYYAKELNFLNNSLGSAGESQFWLEEARNAGLITQQTFERLDNEAVELRKMIVSLMKKVKAEIADKKNVA